MCSFLMLGRFVVPKIYNTYEHGTYYQVKRNLFAAIAAVRIIQVKYYPVNLVNLVQTC